MSSDREDLDLTPTQDLFVETLIGRHRLGEAIWTFDKRHRKTAEQLAGRGLVNWKHGVVDDTILAWLTDTGKKRWLTYPYVPPILRPKEARWVSSPSERPALADIKTRIGNPQPGDVAALVGAVDAVLYKVEIAAGLEPAEYAGATAQEVHEWFVNVTPLMIDAHVALAKPAHSTRASIQ